MTPNWDKSPKGATHWGPKSKSYKECWYKKVGEAWHFCRAGFWKWHPMQEPPSKNRFGRMQVKP